MSCFYCGKRVSLVRKRNDADFCCDDHREKYHARTLRTIETLREADEQIAVTRRLNEGMPLRPTVPLRGKDPASLLQKNLGSPLLFGWVPTGLPASRPIVDTHVPAAALYALPKAARRNGAVPPPRAENLGWNIGHLQEGPRPPRAFTVIIRLPHGGTKQVQANQAACDRPRRLRAAPPVELGTAVRAITRRIVRRPADKSIGALMSTVRPPDPVQPPPPSPPITVTLRPVAMAIRLGRTGRAPAVSVRMPSPGVTGLRSIPPSGGEAPATPAYVRIERRALAIPSTRIVPSGVPRLREIRLGNRFVPCPDGFRRRQFYSWEALDRFCGMGFETIAGHRPGMRIMAAPGGVAHIDVARLWTAPQEDPVTTEPERRRTAPPFPERLSLPGAAGVPNTHGLLLASPGQARIRTLDSRHHFPSVRSWDSFAPFSPVHRQDVPTRIAPARWAMGTGDAFAIPAWARPQTRGSKRTACHLGIGGQKPVFTGPKFQAGERQAGPAPAKLLSPPLFEPAGSRLRSEAVTAVRAALLPMLQFRDRVLGQTPILSSACQPPVGRIAANRIAHPAYAILLDSVLPADRLRAAAVAGLSIHPPARQPGTSFDIAKGSPRLLENESLHRFRRRGYEAMRSRHSAPQWPAPSVPGLVAMATNAACGHPSRQPSSEAALVMFRAHDLPAADDFRLSCTLMDWQLLAPATPGGADWGRVPHVVSIAMPLALMLPVDSLGPIRNWGLAPAPEPEKPPEPVHEDFGAGLANWLCPHADWKQDIAGVRTGSLALLQPSLNMSEYEFEFLCRIENRTIGWVFRAANTTNYHAVQIALDPASGAAHLARYSVLAGEREQPAIAPLDVTLGKTSSCRVKMSILGNEFKLFINDKPVFDWMDDRLSEGGVGFFSDGEDRARLYWVKVTPYFEAGTEEMDSPMPPPGAEIHREIRMGV